MEFREEDDIIMKFFIIIFDLLAELCVISLVLDFLIFPQIKF